MTSPERRSHWSTFKESGIPESAVIFAPNGNGIDIIRPMDEPGYLYEDDCFKAMSEMFPEHYVIGAHLIDYMLVKDKGLAGLKKPDAIFLKYYEGKTLISGFAEFKLYPYRNFSDKLDGFGDLLAKFREDPKRMPRLMHNAVGEFVKVPNNIYTPPDGRFKKFQVTLVTPPPHEDRAKPIYKRPGMHINSLSIPVSAQIAA